MIARRGTCKRPTMSVQECVSTSWSILLLRPERVNS